MHVLTCICVHAYKRSYECIDTHIDDRMHILTCGNTFHFYIKHAYPANVHTPVLKDEKLEKSQVTIHKYEGEVYKYKYAYTHASHLHGHTHARATRARARTHTHTCCHMYAHAHALHARTHTHTHTHIRLNN